MPEAAAGGAAPFYTSPSGDVVLHRGDAAAVLRALPAGSVHTVITSPPYWNLRDYQTGDWEGGDESCDHRNHASVPKGTADSHSPDQPARLGMLKPYRAVCGRCGARRVDAQLGLEESPEAYVAALVAVFREVKRVLRDDGCLWLNLSDSYANDAKWGGATGGKHANGLHGETGIGRAKRETGYPAKCMFLLPWRVAFALIEDGWIVRSVIPWLKRNAMPESAQDRPTTATEYIFLLSKASTYFYDADAVRTPHTDAAVVDGRYARKGGISRPDYVPHTQGWNGGGMKQRDREYHPAGRNRRNADWWFDSLRAILAGATGLLADEDGAPLALPVNPAAFDKAHFATFPPRLVEPMLLASTSARGCCPVCGAPWVRTTERGETDYARLGKHNGADFGRDDSQPGNMGQTRTAWGTVPSLRSARSETTGWRAGCACVDAGDPIPCTILDPFCGSGTVSLVARKHGRHSWGIDLSAAYLEMARERLGQLALPGWSGAAAGG